MNSEKSIENKTKKTFEKIDQKIDSSSGKEEKVFAGISIWMIIGIIILAALAIVFALILSIYYLFFFPHHPLIK